MCWSIGLRSRNSQAILISAQCLHGMIVRWNPGKDRPGQRPGFAAGSLSSSSFYDFPVQLSGWSIMGVGLWHLVNLANDLRGKL